MVVFEPFYDSYLPSAIMAGATLRPITLARRTGRSTPRRPRPRSGRAPGCLLLNTPHNPTGKVFRRDELALLAALCQQCDVVAVTDEVYERIVFDGAEHVPLATLPGMWERTLTINSTGKTFSMTGWKIGYAVGPPALNAALRAVHQFVTFATATPFQDAMALALEDAPALGLLRPAARPTTRAAVTGLRAALDDAGSADAADRRQLLPDGRCLRPRLRRRRRLLPLADHRDRRRRGAALRLLPRSGPRAAAGPLLLRQARRDDPARGRALAHPAGATIAHRVIVRRRRGSSPMTGRPGPRRTCRGRRHPADSRPCRW